MYLTPVFTTGGHCKDNEDEKTHHKRSTANWTGGNPQEHVHSSKENDQGTNRVAYREQIYETGRQKYQYFYISCIVLELGYFSIKQFLICVELYVCI